MRLIDADALIDALGISDEDIVFKETLEDEPTIDAVPVVRCKDCTYYCPLDDSRPYDCLRSGMLCVRKEDFCSCGKER